MLALSYPIPGAPLSDGYGPRDPITTGGGTSGGFHYAQDFAAASGTPILAAADGKVIAAGWIGTYGYAVYIDHGGGIVTRYAHMIAAPPVAVGRHVERGGRIGFVGSTGASTGPHLHFEVVENGSRVDPLKYLTTTPRPPAGQEEDEDMWKPIYYMRTGTGTTEYMVVHPDIGADLAHGKKRASGKVTICRGYMVTTSPGIGAAWAKMYANGGGVNRDTYISIQSEAQRISVELAA